MDYSFQELTVKELFELVEGNKIDLNPSYQRNFIWSPDNQMELIDTILQEYPLPSFFVFRKPEGGYEMVDGQQRTKTIYRFLKGDITSSKQFKKVTFDQVDQFKFLQYRIPVVFIENLKPTDSLKEFYVLINKKGVHLNVAEMNKSEFLDTLFLKLANALLSYQNLINLNLFTEAASRRMNDRAFVEELLAYIHLGIKEKKKSVESVYKTDISDEEYKLLDGKFKAVIDKIAVLNTIKPIAETRYKQKNDFFTLFSFIHDNLDEDIETLKYQYKVLILLDGKDEEGRQFIRPSNDDCASLKEYANNCITQSNSKTAREKRLNFFNSMLKNGSPNNEIIIDVLDYLTTIYGDEKIKMKQVGKYNLIDLEAL